MPRQKWSDPRDPDCRRARKGEHSFALHEDDRTVGLARVWDIETDVMPNHSLVLGIWKDGELTAFIQEIEEENV